MTYIKGSGKIVYDPYRAGMKTRTRGWCILSVDKEITRYYRWWLSYQYHIHLQPPSWDAHVTCIRGEQITDNTIWKKHQGIIVPFDYEHGNIQKFRSGRNDPNNVPGDYYVIDVKCDMISQIRQEAGLRTYESYHLTVGRTYEFNPRVPKRFIKERK